MKYLALLLLISVSCTALAQKKISLEGSVKDSLSQKTLAYATITVYKDGVPAALKSTYTNTSGFFKVTGLDAGKYRVVSSHVGYRNRESVITIAIDKDKNILPDFLLTQTAASLKDVSVTAVKPLIEQDNDKIVYNTENDPAAKTENALDILRKTPFVSVDGDDNVQLNGQSNFKVLLNGKETAMFSQNVSQALKGFPGAVIVKVEVITNPSAKYDAEGVGGIINIITKKRVVGYNGSVNIQGNTNHGGGGSGNLSFKSGRVGLTGFYGGNFTSGLPRDLFTQTTPAPNPVYSQRILKGSSDINYFFQFGNFEASLDLDSLRTMSVYGNISGGHNKTTQTQNILTTMVSPPAVSSSVYNTSSQLEYPSYNIGWDYVEKYKSSPDKELDLKFFGEFANNNSLIGTSQLASSGNRFVNNNNMSDNKQYTAELDYVLPLKKGVKLETGVKGIFRKATADFQSLLTYDLSVPYKIDPTNTNNFRYTQDVLSAYASYNFNIKKYNFRLGARVENTEVNGDFVSSGSVVHQNYTNLIPNIQVVRRFSALYTAVLSYSLRLQRPGITSLNPFVNNNDSLNISYGNPNLGPQTINSVSFQSRFQKGNLFAGITLTGSYSNNAIETFATFNSAKGVIATTSDNIGREYQVGVSTNMSIKFSNVWRFFLNGSLTYNYAQNKFMLSQSNDGFSGVASVSNTFTINDRFSLGLNGGFFAFPVTVQTSRSIQQFYNLNATYKFFHEKLSLTAFLQNFLLKDYTFTTTTRDPAFTTISDLTGPFRSAGMSIGWNFGKLKENVSKKKTVVNDDVLPAPAN